MIKLESNYDWNNTEMYFHTMRECEEYMYVFKNHWCNIRWKKPIEVPDDTKLSAYQRKDMERSPKERAECNLSWGFNMEKKLEMIL